MFKKFAAIAALAFVSSASFAAESPLASSFYTGLEIGRTSVFGHGGERDNSKGAFAGYQFHQNIAVEASYRSLFDYMHDVPGSTQAMHVRSYSYGASVLGILPFSNGFSLFGRVGYNRIESKASHPLRNLQASDKRGYFGLGVSYAITPSISVRVERQEPTQNSRNVSAGVFYKF